MKVKHPAPALQQRHPKSMVEDDKAPAATSDVKVDDPVMPETIAIVASEPHEDAELHLLPHKEKELETDLAFERDEMLRRDNLVTAQGPKVWKVKGMGLKLSALEATVAVKRGIFIYEDFEVYAPPAHVPVDDGPADPLSGALSAALGAFGTVAQRVGDYPLLLAKVLEAKEEHQAEKEIAEFAKDSGKGVTGIVGAGLKAPMDITHNISRGFHNLPKMYGDETVRPLDKVTDVQSGLQAAGKGLGYGLWDGLSGLVTQPMKGAQEGGWMGGLAGFGKGVGGAVFKPAAGAFGLPGYAFKGIYEEVKTRGMKQEMQSGVGETQMVQGFKEWETTSEKEQNDILLRIKREIEDLETLEG